jgi:hypothetical protein
MMGEAVDRSVRQTTECLKRKRLQGLIMSYQQRAEIFSDIINKRQLRLQKNLL